MSDSTTVHLGLTKPAIDASADTWGQKLNTNLDLIDAAVANLDALTAAGAPFLTFPGIIVMWSGLATAIPASWAICDGTNGTPDLRSCFIVAGGAGSKYGINETGGNDAMVLSADNMPQHTHGVTDPGHQHGVNEPGGVGHQHLNPTQLHHHDVSDPGHNHTFSTSPGGDPNKMFSAYTADNTASPGHTDGAVTGVVIQDAVTGGVYTNPGTTGISIAVGTTGLTIQPNAVNPDLQTFDNRPKYYALAFIMKLPPGVSA